MAAEVAPDDLAAQRNDQGLLGFFSLDSQHPVDGTADHEGPPPKINDERDILRCPSRREESGGGVVVPTDRAGVGARHQVVAGALNATLNPAGLAVGRNVVKRLPEEVG